MNGDLPAGRGVICVGKVLDPGDHCRSRETGAIALNKHKSKNVRTGYDAGAERIRTGTFEVNGSGER